MRSRLQISLAAALATLSFSSLAAMPQPGLWQFNAEVTGQPGRGVQIERAGGRTVILSYFGYRADGSATFLQAVGPLKDGKTFSAPLLEYKNGKVIGGPLQSGTEAANHGTVTVEFDTATSGAITLPGENKTEFSRFTYEDLTRRLNNTFSVTTFWPSERGYGLRKDATLIINAKDGRVRMNHFSVMNAQNPSTIKQCIFEGDLIPAGAGFRSEGEVKCKPDADEHTYKDLDLRVDEYGMLNARVEVYSGGGFNGSMTLPIKEVMYITGHCIAEGKDATGQEVRCSPEMLGLTPEDFYYD